MQNKKIYNKIIERKNEIQIKIEKIKEDFCKKIKKYHNIMRISTK